MRGLHLEQLQTPLCRVFGGARFGGSLDDHRAARRSRFLEPQAASGAIEQPHVEAVFELANLFTPRIGPPPSTLRLDVTGGGSDRRIRALDEVRIDKWLWAARCFKTRSGAATACNAGHVKVNGTSTKPARLVRAGDHLEVRTPGGLRLLEIVALADRRGPASVARTLYIDHSPPPPPKEVRAAVPTREKGAGRPSKRERRQLRKLRGY